MFPITAIFIANARCWRQNNNLIAHYYFFANEYIFYQLDWRRSKDGMEERERASHFIFEGNKVSYIIAIFVEISIGVSLVQLKIEYVCHFVLPGAAHNAFNISIILLLFFLCVFFLNKSTNLRTFAWGKLFLMFLASTKFSSIVYQFKSVQQHLSNAFIITPRFKLRLLHLKFIRKIRIHKKLMDILLFEWAFHKWCQVRVLNAFYSKFMEVSCGCYETPHAAARILNTNPLKFRRTSFTCKCYKILPRFTWKFQNPLKLFLNLTKY